MTYHSVGSHTLTTFSLGSHKLEFFFWGGLHFSVPYFYHAEVRIPLFLCVGVVMATFTDCVFWGFVFLSLNPWGGQDKPPLLSHFTCKRRLPLLFSFEPCCCVFKELLKTSL